MAIPDSVIQKVAGAKYLAVLTGAGISAESGVPTFRGKDGLWKNFRAEDLATPEAFERDPKLVWEWYDWRRGIIGDVSPNPGHEAIARLEKIFPQFQLVTQNVDGLHEKAGSRKIEELHGNIWKMRCLKEKTVVSNREVPLKQIPPYCGCGSLMRPHIVWFGESLFPGTLEVAFQTAEECDCMLVVGTSAVVQPAASLPLGAKRAGAYVVEINPERTPISDAVDATLLGKSGEVLPELEFRISRRS